MHVSSTSYSSSQPAIGAEACVSKQWYSLSDFAALTSRERNVSALAVRLDQRGLVPTVAQARVLVEHTPANDSSHCL